MRAVKTAECLCTDSQIGRNSLAFFVPLNANAQPTLNFMKRLNPGPDLPPGLLQETVDWAIVSRRSIRAFLPTPVEHAEVDAILDVARHAASGVNTQPWKVHVLIGAAKLNLSEAVCAANDGAAPTETLAEPYPYYPKEWVSPYLERRRKVGWDLYRLLGIDKADKARMHHQHSRNYRFFDAPVGLIFTIDRVMQMGSLIDCGMFLQSVMLAARARGLDTCAQVAFTRFHRVIADQLALPASEMVVCGMSLGHVDPRQIENTLVTDREPVTAFTTHHV
jgi:nitroreductase